MVLDLSIGLSTDSEFVAACDIELIDPDWAVDQVRAGRLVFLRAEANRGREGFRPLLVGGGTRRKIAALVGLGPHDRDRAAIVNTMQVIIAARPDAVMDLTTNPEGVALRGELAAILDVPLGACLTYDLFANPHQPRYTEQEFLEKFEAGLVGDVDFVLVHAGLSRDVMAAMDVAERVMSTTSRGGGVVARYMRRHRCENPLVEWLDGIAEICRRLGVVLDLGDIFRPGCTADAGDDLKWLEIQHLAVIRQRAVAGGTQVLCEAGGHMPVHRIGELIPAYKKELGGPPLWLVGPMVIDTGVTLDSIVNTLGIAAAAAVGGDMFASITQNEHYAMPTAAETAEAVRNARVAIAAHDLARGFPPEVERNLALSLARARNQWGEQAPHALYPDLARQVFLQHNLVDGAPCTICGSVCPHIVTGRVPQ